jgi:hypothetical protein
MVRECKGQGQMPGLRFKAYSSGPPFCYIYTEEHGLKGKRRNLRNREREKRQKYGTKPGRRQD